jgi:hypothetical protein
MKTKFLILFMLMTASAAYAGSDHENPQPKISPELARMQTLKGEWEGTMTDCNTKEPKPVKARYGVTSAGAAVVETLFPGTEMEMVSVYYDRKGKLAMTHYCMIGNQPELDLVKSTDKELVLDFAKRSTINPKKEHHMHALTLEFVDTDHIQAHWTGMDDGVAHEGTSDLKRVKV